MQTRADRELTRKIKKGTGVLYKMDEEEFAEFLASRGGAVSTAMLVELAENHMPGTDCTKFVCSVTSS
jgi:hypothetical protein